MKENVMGRLQMLLRRAAMAVLALGTVAAGAAEPVRYQQGAEYAVLDLTGVTDQKLNRVPGLTLPGLISGTSHSVFAVSEPAMDALPVRDFGPIDTVLSYELAYELDRLFDVKQVRAQVLTTDTDTTFMLTE